MDPDQRAAEGKTEAMGTDCDRINRLGLRPDGTGKVRLIDATNSAA